MRRALTVCLAAAALIVLAGCSADAKPTWAQRNAEFAVLGSVVPTASSNASVMPGLAANSIPKEAFAGVPGAGRIVVASGTPVVSREQAIQAAKPEGGTLVSAVDVLLPVEVTRAMLDHPREAKPTTAWVVTWTRVTQRIPRKVRVGGKTVSKTFIRHGDTTVVIDATTGKRLAITEYPTP